jgi:dienelactone hydrolase
MEARPMHSQRLVAALALAACTIVSGAAGSPSAGQVVAGSWIGTFDLGGTGEITFSVSGRRALVALGAGQASAQALVARGAAGRIRFALPGRPAPLVFEGRLRRGAIEGTVRQGVLRGTFRARRGQGRELLARGYYGDGERRQAVVDDPFGPPRLVDLGSGAVRALYPAGRGFSVGSGFQARTPESGTASFDAAAATIDGTRSARLNLRQLEVRFPTRGAILAGTLTLPPGPGPHAAVAFVHGSGQTTRAYLPDLHAALVGHGVAVLAYDKRGIGQSGGSYPGEFAGESTIDVLARDAAAAARFLAAQPEVDRTRVGLAGHSQAGWIMPLAASRESAVRYLVSFAGPTVSQGESDAFGDLAGEGQQLPARSEDEIDAEVERLGPSGYDPLPSLRALRVPALFLYGGLDRHVPTRLCLRRLEPLLAGRDFAVEVFPQANHALVETQRGLNEEMLRSDRFAPGLFPRLGEWLRAHGITR